MSRIPESMDVFFPAWLALPVLVFLYRPLLALFPKLDRDRYVRRVVAAGNRFFYRKFLRTAPAERMLFLPYCLRAGDCPTLIDPEAGLVCAADCLIPCRLGEMKRLALALGYRDALVVVSGSLHRQEGVLRSRDFLVRRIGEQRPKAVIGCLCSRDLREKYLRPANISPGGSLGGHGLRVVPQICLLSNSHCRRSAVDWTELEGLIRAGVSETGGVS